MRISLQRILLILSLCLLPISVMAQSIGSGNIGNNLSDFAQTNWLVAGKVRTVEGDPVRGATVTVAPLDSLGVRVLTTNAQGEFRTEYELNVRLVQEFGVVVTARKKGFQEAHTFANFGNSGRTWALPLILHEPHEDPTLLSPADLISGLAPKLRQLGPSEGLGAKSEKDYARGVADFLDKHDPERAVPLLAKVLKNSPSCIGCRTMLGLTEMGWCDWDEADNTLAESVNATLHDRTMGRPEALVAYGTWLNWQHDTEKAASFFAEALKFAPQDALTLQELGRTLLALQQFLAASDYLNKALALGAGPEARLLYVQALLGTGRSDDASAEMKRYLNGRDVKEMPARVRQVWASVQNREKTEALYAKAKTQNAREQVDFLRHPPADLIRGLEPAGDQEQLNSILDGVGTKIVDLIKDFPNTSSLEAVHQEKLSRKGAVRGSQAQKFRYLCLVPRDAWGPGFVEYRGDSSGMEATPKGLTEGFMLTRGFASAAFLFHPTYRAESTFHYLGRQKVNGRNTYVVAFAQIPGKARFNGIFRSGQVTVTTLSQGLAWIDADTYQVIRLHTDLLAPFPELRLEKETLSIDFNAVHFKHMKDPLWLPEDVTVTLDWNGKVLRNRHQYSDFRIFNVDAAERIGKPKAAAQTSPAPQEPTVSP